MPESRPICLSPCPADQRRSISFTSIMVPSPPLKRPRPDLSLRAKALHRLVGSLELIDELQPLVAGPVSHASSLVGRLDDRSRGLGSPDGYQERERLRNVPRHRAGLKRVANSR